MTARSNIENDERMVSLMMFLDQRDMPARKRDIERSIEGYTGLDEGNPATVKMLSRDLANLETIGVYVDVRYSQDHGTAAEPLYSLDRQKTFSTGISLTSDEMLILRFASLASLGDPSFPYGEALRSALTKLSLSADIDEDDKLPDPDNTIGADQPEHRKVTLLEAACQQRKLVRFSYEDASGNQTSRKVEPYTVYPYEGCWYLVCFDLGRQDRRVFRVSRMSALKRCSAQTGPDFAARDIDTSDLPVLSFSIGDEEPFEVCYLIPRAMSNGTWDAESRVIQRRADLSQVEGHPDMLLMRATARSTVEAARWALRYSPGTTVVSPRKVIDAYEAGLAKVVCDHGE